MSAHMSIRMSMHAFAHVYLRVYTCRCILLCAHPYTCLHTCLFTSLHTCSHTRANQHVDVHLCSLHIFVASDCPIQRSHECNACTNACTHARNARTHAREQAVAHARKLADIHLCSLHIALASDMPIHSSMCPRMCLCALNPSNTKTRCSMSDVDLRVDRGPVPAHRFAHVFVPV